MKKAVAIFSGGPDSTAAALWAVDQGYETELLTFQFRNRTQYGELKAAMDIAGALSLKHTLFDFKSSMEHFQPNAHILMHAGVEANVIDKSQDHRLPFGAAMILTVASNYAIYNGADTLVWGATKSDSQSGNYEYTQDFCDDLSVVLTRILGKDFKIIAPFAEMRKYQVIRTHFAAREDLFAKTWSCKSGLDIQSGNCHASRARRVAARMAGIKDLTIYANDLHDWIFTDEEFSDPSKIDPSKFGGEGSNG